jgi:hypothetical protein
MVARYATLYEGLLARHGARIAHARASEARVTTGIR